ncbi:sterol carrier family protein [Streptomyces sp. NPDC059070]|uniref:maleylpyruvate isomerase family mycothiol-dependent enzyme n=1 Tax=Streptomyces sp. NPDC059070 TaxID=3346713 RepID=UPI00367B6FB6
MPPAKKRARTRGYDPAKTRTAVLAQFASVREAVRALTPEQLDRPTRLDGRTVRDLAVHLADALDAVARGLAGPAPAAADLALLEWPAARPAVPGPAAAGESTAAPGQGPDADLDARYARVAARVEELLPGADPARPVATGCGAMTLGDLMVTRTVELCLHTDDLNDALPGLDIPYDRQALAACTRLLADALAARAPGGSVEVRIPPYAVVQCVEGPRHTRGTPPNVVETDPLTWLRLATGRTAWSAELDAARVAAGGERADLSALLPLHSGRP